MGLFEKFKKALTPELILYPEPKMKAFGKLDEHRKPSKEEVERMERRKLLCNQQR